MTEPEALTPTQQEAQGKIDALWADRAHPVHNPGHRLHEQAQEEFQSYYRARYPEPTPDAVADQAATHETESTPRPNVVDDPYHTDPTAAVLDAVPLPEGLDPEKSRAVNVLAEREGMTRFVLEGRHVIAGALAAPPVDPVAAERLLQQRWGSMFPSKLAAAHLAFDALPDAVRADLERRDLDVHPAVLDYLARVGEALMDPSTPGGERRLRAKYSQQVERHA